MNSVIDSLFQPNKFQHMDSFPQDNDHNLTPFKLDVLAKKLSKEITQNFKWTEEIEDSFQACDAVIFDDFGRSSLSNSDIQLIIFKNICHLPDSHLSFVVVSLSLFARKEDETLISEYIDKLLESYSTYIKIFKFACDSLNHEILKEK